MAQIYEEFPKLASVLAIICSRLYNLLTKGLTLCEITRSKIANIFGYLLNKLYLCRPNEKT